MFTIAEFVESAPDAQALGQLGVDFLQGYYFGAPSMKPPWQTKDTAQAVH
jgi:EAL domain-containing protein (putative c-di-GMP-specific phosphodiesterase class I)